MNRPYDHLPGKRVPGLGLLAGILLAGSWPGVAPAESPRASDYLQLPPVMARLMGDPRIEFVASESEAAPGRIPGRVGSRSIALRRVTATSATALRVAERRHPGSITVVSPRDRSAEAVREAVARSISEFFWGAHFEGRDNRLELIPLTRHRFVRIGQGQLTRRPVSDELGNAWWRVRMGLPLTPDPDYHLILSDCFTESLNLPYGHFAVGLRRRGGDLEEDLAIDPRAPRYEAEAPALVEYLNANGSMVNGVHTWNLWDWYHTQVQYRDITLKMRIVSLAREQALLLKQLAHRDDLREVGPFRVATFNCATLGLKLMDSLLPLDRPIRTGQLVVKTPGRGIRKAAERFPFVTALEIPSETIKNGRELTSRSDVRPAPDRVNTVVFQILSRIPEIN